ncbi:MAG: FAD-dependent oxidoreductase [Candidatus Bathyarchaeota archaeon]|nr:MAG: FAD-dependent oxidoreductase [Candidatus Bathyarchaeota archaeon]
MESPIIPKVIREKTKYCFECGICTASCPMVELLSTHYNPRSLLQKALNEPEKTLDDDKLWLCAWCYKCYKRCPQGLKPPEIFQLLKNRAMKLGLFNGFKRATSIMKEKVPFPLICWYACFHPERAEIGDKKITEVLKKLAKQPKLAKGIEEDSNHKDKVAIIGSGPAGLTAASILAEIGYPVTIFEALPEAGGMLRKSMPKYRLPRKVLESEIQRLRDLGVKLRTGTKVSKDISFDEIKQDGYKAIFVAVGAHKSRKLGIEGEELERVVDALDFLWKVNTQQQVNLGKKVGIIGGGNVAIDAARTALLQGAKEVIILYRRSREEMLANPWEVAEAEKEGVKIKFLVTPVRISEKEGRVQGLKCVRMKLGVLDETGRKKPMPIEGSEFSLKLDTVIVAIGETTETTFLPENLEVDKGGWVQVNPFTMETNIAGVFAGGDMVTGPATVIEAILAGKKAAYSINQYLTRIRKKEENHCGD